MTTTPMPQMHEPRTRTQQILEYGMATLGTATLASLVRFEINPAAVVTGYAAIVIALLLTAKLTGHKIFLYQSLVMLGVTAFRIAMYNFYELHESFASTLQSSVWAIGLLAIGGIPLCFLLRAKNSTETGTGNWLGFLVQHPEQPMFFVPVVLMGVLLALKFQGGMATLAWGVEGFIIFLFALWVKERSFRLTGLVLVLLAVGKLIGWDAWFFHDSSLRYITWIMVGILVLGISFLYGRNRGALREYL
jgi:hypothetical protein